MTARIVELFRVIVVGDLSMGLAGRDLEHRRLEVGHGLVQAFGHPVTHPIQILQIRRKAAVLIRKAVAVWGAVRVGGPDQNVRGGNAGHFRPNLISQRGGEAQKIGCHDANARGAVVENQRAHAEIILLAGRRMRGANSSGYRQQRVRCHNPHRHARPEFGARQAGHAARTEGQDQEREWNGQRQGQAPAFGWRRFAGKECRHGFGVAVGNGQV